MSSAAGLRRREQREREAIRILRPNETENWFSRFYGSRFIARARLATVSSDVGRDRSGVWFLISFACFFSSSQPV